MPRERCPDSYKAEEMFKDGMALSEIAKKLGAPAGTVRRWKSTQKWGRESERSESKTNVRIEKELTREDKNMSPEWQLFCVLYVNSYNATQSYLKAYRGCSYNTAMVNGHKLLQKPIIRGEVNRLKEIKKESLLAGEEDIVERHMKIAFSDIGDYLTFGREEVPIMGPYGPVSVEDKSTGEMVELKRAVNYVKLNESDMVDTSIIAEIKQGKDGVSIKLADAQKSMTWLDKYFLMNPMDRHRIEFDKRKMEIDLLKVEMTLKESDNTENTGSDNFVETLNDSAKKVWPND